MFGGGVLWETVRQGLVNLFFGCWCVDDGRDDAFSVGDEGNTKAFKKTRDGFVGGSSDGLNGSYGCQSALGCKKMVVVVVLERVSVGAVVMAMFAARRVGSVRVCSRLGKVSWKRRIWTLIGRSRGERQCHVDNVDNKYLPSTHHSAIILPHRYCRSISDHNHYQADSGDDRRTSPSKT